MIKLPKIARRLLKKQKIEAEPNSIPGHEQIIALKASGTKALSVLDTLPYGGKLELQYDSESRKYNVGIFPLIGMFRVYPGVIATGATADDALWSLVRALTDIELLTKETL